MVFGAVVGSIAMIKYVFFRTVRLRKEHADRLMELIYKKGKSFVLYQEIVTEGMPKEYSALCYFNGLFIKLAIEERMMRAGFTGTDSVCRVTLARFQMNRLLNILKEMKLDKDEIPIYILQTWESERIGTLIPEKITPYLEPEDYADVEEEIQKVISGEVNRTGVIMYGSPGNGKSFLIRYFCLKYRLPVYIISFTTDMNNQDLIRMFRHIHGPAIVLFEDFDNYFDKRTCLMPDSKFTFDTLLNIFDGLFTTHKQIIFAMTANDITKIDDALKLRPSRFRYLVKVNNPSEQARRRIFASENGNQNKLVNMTSGYNLDTIMCIRDRVDQGITPEWALAEFKENELRCKEVEIKVMGERKTENEKRKGRSKRTS